MPCSSPKEDKYMISKSKRDRIIRVALAIAAEAP